MRSILIDTNVVVLLVVGVYSRELVGRHKRTREFSAEDFDVLVSKLDEFEEVWVTSHCLAEASNFLKQHDNDMARGLLACLASFGKNTRESHIPMLHVFGQPLFESIGIADTGILLKSKRVACVLTTDFELYQRVLHVNGNAINFHHLRMPSLLA